jgi:hypothetical protein
MFAIAPSLLQVINASAFAPSGPGPSVAGVPLSSSEPVFRNLDDALEWCEEVLLQAHVKSAPVTTSPPPSLSPPPLSPPRANGNALASALTTHSTWPPAAGAAHVAQGDGPIMRQALPRASRGTRATTAQSRPRGAPRRPKCPTTRLKAHQLIRVWARWWSYWKTTCSCRPRQARCATRPPRPP